MFWDGRVQTVSMISHRGAAGLAPENTIVALQEGKKYGANFVEVDVQRSSDGVLLLMHDRTIARTTNGVGAVVKLEWEDVRGLDAGTFFSPEFSGEGVPSLDETFLALAGMSTSLAIEIKNPKLYPGIEQQIVEIVNQYDESNNVIVLSLDHAWLKDFIELAPDIPTGYLYVGPVFKLKSAEAEVVSVHWLNVITDPTLVWRMHRQNKTVWVWTVNSPRLMRLLIGLGVDGITTDRPDLMANIDE